MAELKFIQIREGHYEARREGVLFTIKQTSRDNFVVWTKNLLSGHTQTSGWFRSLANAKARLNEMATKPAARGRLRGAKSRAAT